MRSWSKTPTDPPEPEPRSVAEMLDAIDASYFNETDQHLGAHQRALVTALFNATYYRDPTATPAAVTRPATEDLDRG